MSKFLFDSIEAAQEMAYMLQAEWDGCNGILLSQIDDAAIETAAGLCRTDWCRPFDKCQLPLLQREELLQRYSQGERHFHRWCLVGVNLSHQDLTGIYLIGANLAGADLTGACFEAATLLGASLENSKLRGANLSRTRLIGANLTGADLKSANLEKAHMSEASLQGANLEAANLREAFLTDANLEAANLSEAVLTKAFLSRVNLEAANLCNAVLIDAVLFKTNLNRAIVSRTDLGQSPVQTGANFINRGANFKGAILTESIMPDGKLYNHQANFLINLIVICALFLSSIFLVAQFWLWGMQQLMQQPSAHDAATELKAQMMLEKQAASLKRD